MTIASASQDISNKNIQSIFQSIATLIKDHPQKAIQELENLYSVYMNAENGINMAICALLPFVERINNDVYNDFSNDGITRAQKKLKDKGITQNQAIELYQDVKKKCILI